MASELEGLNRSLAELLALLSEESLSGLDATSAPARRLRKLVDQVSERLRHLAERLDPIQRPPFVFDPSNPNTIGRLIAQTLLEQERKPLANLSKFYGSGVYALYYSGRFAAYGPIRGKETPIYVGKADPPTPDAKTFVEQGLKLSARLAEHAKSILAASKTLRLEDFECRFLVVQSGWQRSAEDYLLNQFHPIWNSKACYGFGKHGDDHKTRGNQRSPWDSLHPGRPWATKAGNKPNANSNEEILALIADHFRQFPPPR